MPDSSVYISSTTTLCWCGTAATRLPENKRGADEAEPKAGKAKEPKPAKKGKKG